MTQHDASIFSIATGSPEPIYRQLVEQARRMIIAGQLAEGDDMPSVREVAHALTLNPMTVSKAYSILELEGLLTRRRGQGMTVAGQRATQASFAERCELLRPSMTRVAQEAKQLEVPAPDCLNLFQQILKDTL